MTDQPLPRWPDTELIDALRRLEPEIAWPRATPSDGRRDLAQAVRARLESSGPPATGPGRSIEVASRWRPGTWTWQPTRRALLIAIALLIAFAALAGAAGLGLPGLRLLLGAGPASPPPTLQPSRSPSPSSPSAPDAPGAGLRLGEPGSPADPASIDVRARFHVRWPSDPLAGPPDVVYVDRAKHGQVSLVWATRPDLPATLEPGVGLLMTQFQGFVDPQFYSKVLGSDTTVEPVLVDGQRGYWLSGAPHFFFYTGPDGVVQDDRRWVGDALIWSDGGITYRLESTLGRDTTIRIAESLR